uniref:Uncharacterized protein n=1 Tax=Opuntia streptacantha TaxID=393608 RepID=A0A7C9D337_OPUST
MVTNSLAGQSLRISFTGPTGSSSFSILLQLRSATDASSCPDLSITTPGQSNNLTFLSNCTSCIDLVNPGVAPTLTTWHLFKLLIRLLLPTLGSPTIPTVIDFLIS